MDVRVPTRLFLYGLVEATIRGWTDVRTRRAAIGKVSNKLHNGFGMGRAVPSRIHAEHNASVPQTITKEDAPRIRPADAGYFQIPESLAEIHNFWLIRQRARFVSISGIAWFHWFSRPRTGRSGAKIIGGA